jgi:hypothetical protein
MSVSTSSESYLEVLQTFTKQSINSCISCITRLGKKGILPDFLIAEPVVGGTAPLLPGVSLPVAGLLSASLSQQFGLVSNLMKAASVT